MSSALKSNKFACGGGRRRKQRGQSQQQMKMNELLLLLLLLGCECGSRSYLLKLRAELRVDPPLELLGGLPVHLERRAIDFDADETY